MLKTTIKSKGICSSVLTQDGFSLVELIVIVGIISILAAISMTSMDLVRKQRVSSVTTQLLGDLQSIRLQGMVTGPSGTSELQFIRGGGIRLISATQYATFLFDDCSQNYTYDGNGCAGQTWPGAPREESGTQIITVPNGVQIKRYSGSYINPTNSVNDIVLFDHLGLARNSAWATNAAPLPMVIVVQGQSVASSCINVSSNVIREGAWDGANCNAK